MGSTQQGQAVVEMVLVGSLKELERQTHTETGLSEKKKNLLFSVNLRFSGKVWRGHRRNHASNNRQKVHACHYRRLTASSAEL